MPLVPMPDGFSPVETEGFGGFSGPVLGGADADGPVFLFDIAAKHLNLYGRLHGGMMMGLMSMVMGEGARTRTRAGNSAAKTRPLSLNCDFISAGEPGDRVEGRTIVTRATRSILFMRGSLMVGERLLMTATGVYAVETEGRK